MTPSAVPQRATGSAYGKLILLGEHAVVHGVPALVCGVGLSVHAEATRAPAGVRELELLGTRAVADSASTEELARAFAALLDEDAVSAAATGGLMVKVSGDLPPGVGLGFSAAAAVAIARAVGALEHGDRGAHADAERVERRATAWERIYHGNPSGVDVAAAMHGGMMRFVRGQGVERVSVGAPLLFCVGLTGTRSSTREMVEGVARLEVSQPDMFTKSMDGVRSLVDNAIAAVERGDARSLGELMDLNQMILAGLMLSTPEIEELCASAREAGALGAKLTGAGGGGAVVALAGRVGDAEAQAQTVVGAWSKLGYRGFVAELGLFDLEPPR